METLSLQYLLFKSLMHQVLSKRTKYSASFYTLFRSHSYRVTTKESNSIVSIFRYFVRASRLLAGNNSNTKIKEDCIIFDGDFKQKNERLDYVQDILKRDVGYFALNQMPSCNLGWQKIPIFIHLFFSTVLYSLLSLFLVKKRGVMGLSLLSFVETIILVKICKVNGIKELYVFYTFENESNMQALLLEKYGVKVIKVLSENVLNRFHSHLVSTEVKFSVGFHLDNYKELKSDWYITKYELWPLYRFNKLRKSYRKDGDYKYSVGFISSGIWKREQLGIVPLEAGDFESEKELIVWLKNMLKQGEMEKLFIYLHPIESKTDELYAEAVDHYTKEFGENNVEFSEKNKPSYLSFDKVEVSVASYSTAQLQRLYCGYKVIYSPSKFETNLYSNTALEDICVSNYDDFLNLTNRVLRISEEQYFSNYNLLNYLHSQKS